MQRDAHPSGTKKIGLVGGLALRAGIFYYDRIAERYASEGRRLELVLGHADVGTVLAHVGAGDRAGLGVYLGSVANTLFDAGADVVAITAVAPHLAIREIADIARGPLVNVLDTLPAALATIDRVAIFGNRAVMETRLFGTIPERMTARLKPSILDEVHRAYGDIALHGKRGSQPEMHVLEDIARDVIGQDGAQAILLAGTDLSSFYAEQPPTYPFLDMARLHIDDIVRRARAP